MQKLKCHYKYKLDPYFEFGSRMQYKVQSLEYIECFPSMYGLSTCTEGVRPNVQCRVLDKQTYLFSSTICNFPYFSHFPYYSVQFSLFFSFSLLFLRRTFHLPIFLSRVLLESLTLFSIFRDRKFSFYTTQTIRNK